MRIIPHNQVPKKLLHSWRSLLIEPHLVDHGIFIKTQCGLCSAIPVGSFRKTGNFCLQFQDFQEIIDILYDKSGFPDVRTTGHWDIIWGEDLVRPSNMDFRVYNGRMFGYLESEIQDFVASGESDEYMQSV